MGVAFLLLAISDATVGAFVAASAAVAAAALTTFGVVRSAQRQREPTLIEATQSVLMDVNRALVSELARVRESCTEMEIECGHLRREAESLRKENTKLRLIHRLEREIVEGRDAEGNMVREAIDDAEGFMAE